MQKLLKNSQNRRHRLPDSLRWHRKTLLAEEAEKCPYNGYQPLAVLKNDLRKNSSGNNVIINANITDQSGRFEVVGAGVEVWHLSNPTDGYSHRAKLISDENGFIRFQTDLPARELGKSFRIYFKISIGERSYYTKLSFNHSMAVLARMSLASNTLNLSRILRADWKDTALVYDLEVRLQN